MKFKYSVEIEVKNDAATQEMGRDDLNAMLLGILENSTKLDSVPWVINYHYAPIKE